ncbi:DEAD/DEAH box helicase [Mariniphaga sp.]|uniref:DEAD/DEAH box helicase n=1 Tax=Mariniphaga sp. TaxID=1954475 RepID=UPI0035652E56
MEETEFVIVLTEHRYLGNIFQPYFIHKKDKFYSTEKVVKPVDVKDGGYNLKPYEKELVAIIDKYSDERLMKRFSRAKNVTEFYASLEPSWFQKNIVPFIEECMFAVTRILMLSPVRLLNKEAKYANLYDEDEIQVPPLFARPVFYFERNPQETRYRLKIFLDDKEIPLLNRNLRIVANSPCIFISRSQLIVFEKLDAKKLTPFFSKEYVSVPQSMEEKYYAGFVRKAIRDYEVNAIGFQYDEGEVEKAGVLTLDKNLKYEPCFVLTFRYGDENFLPNSPKEVAVQFQKKKNDFSFKKIKRAFDWEKSVFSYLAELGLKEKDGYFILKGLDLLGPDDALYFLVNWLNENKQRLQEKGIWIEQGKLDKNYFTGKQQIEIKTGISGDWFDVYALVTFGPFSFPFIKLKNYILNDIREFELPNGEIAIIPEEWFARYKSLLPFARSRGEKLQFGRHHYALLQNILQPGGDSILNKFQQLAGIHGTIHLPEELNAELRSYQKTGFQWMFGLHKNGFGGCLADDMGLGKTLQTLALLLKFKRPEKSLSLRGSGLNDGQLSLFSEPETNEKMQPASLIVLPTSLVHNWEAEIQKFTPSLKVYKHVGQQRKTNSDLEIAALNFDVILTTYGTVRNDVEQLAKLKFFYLILDESQYVKNPASKTYKAIMKLQSEHRMALTGTPIENSLSDLWAQLNFLNKGMLGNLAFFRRYFITPIEKHNSSDQQEKLQILIRPFVLRRTKEEVASDLPPLMEQTVFCEMDEIQQRTYETEKSIIRNSILAGIENEGVKKSAMIILQGLTRLRQLANHPKLLSDLEEQESGKFEEIFRMLENVVAEKHKVLIFSSFVKHLELIKSRIESENWKYSILTGQTSNRKEVIRQFQDDSENRIFLISLKAGGVGLNLTSADYVFIIDPWWNPAAENQAISRAHRIGQNKHVFVYRFITQNSIEEKIKQLQDRKSSLADKFINSNNPLQEISKEELMNLLD